jgi:hypothetical protein
MTTREAREKLLLYRGPIDEADPQFEEALNFARRDPELAGWLREHVKCFEDVRSKLREIEPPVGLPERIVRDQPIPFRRNWGRILQLAAAIIVSVAATFISLKLWNGRDQRVAQATEITVKGEVLDMTCYIAYNMSGPEHAADARECIRKGLPVGIKSEDGRVYLLTGPPQHSINAEFADYAAQIVTVRGKETNRDGFAQIQVEEVRKF